MKIQFRQIEPFLKNPPSSVRAILVYGSDAGLVRERAKILGATAVKDLNDPFNVSVLRGSQLVEDPARLSDEANAISMMGGRRLVRIEDAGDSIALLFKEFLKEGSGGNTLIILEAGELGPRSALRSLFEKDNAAAALPCYVEDEKDVAALARRVLAAQGYTIAPEALDWLASSIAGDRQRVNGELEKLVTYMGAQKQIGVDEVLACCGQAGIRTLDRLTYGASGARAEEALAAWSSLAEEGLQPVVALRALQNHFRRLHLAKAYLENGLPAEEAMKKLSPPVFFKQEQDFRSQLRRWSMAALETVMQRLYALEAQCKQTSMPAEILCSQALLAISNAR